MITLHPTIQHWFDAWDSVQPENIPVTDDFAHTSPFGTISPKSKYMDIVAKNRENFLGNQIIILDYIQEDNSHCVRYSLKNENTGLEMSVCEWLILEGGLIREVHAYYNIGDAQLKG